MRMVISAVAVIWMVALAGAAGAQGKPEGEAAVKLPGLPAVLGELRKGGLVVYLRHGATDVSTGASDEKSDLARCETQRNLSAQGRAQAAAIGEGVRALKIPVGTVLSSAFCRCKDTAQLAFGRHQVSESLYFAIGVGAEERARLTKGLRAALSTAPAAGTNTVIVSHTANLREAAGIWPKPEGVAYVFRPLPAGRFEPVAMVLPEEWSAVAKASARGAK